MPLALKLHINSQKAVSRWQNIAVPNALSDVIALNSLCPAASNMSIANIKVSFLPGTSHGRLILKLFYAQSSILNFVRIFLNVHSGGELLVQDEKTIDFFHLFSGELREREVDLVAGGGAKHALVVVVFGIQLVVKS